MILLTLIIIITVLIHELGHCIIPYMKHLNPKIRVRWFGMDVVWDDWDNTTLFDLVNISMCGIFAGAMVLLLSPIVLPQWVYWLYVGSCALDIWNVVACGITILFKGYDAKIKDAVIKFGD